MAHLLPKDITLDDIHICVECDDSSNYEKDHSTIVDESKVKVLVKKGMDPAVATDILQHYQGDDKTDEFDALDAYTEFFQHTEFHRDSKTH